MMNEVYSVEQIREIVAPVAKKHGVERMFLFGSYARGDATADSDIDLRIDASGISDFFALGGLYADLEEKLGKSLDIVKTKNMSEKFYNYIKDQEIMLYEL